MLPAYVPSKKTQDGIMAFYRQSYQLLNQQWNIRAQLLDIDRSYMREMDLTSEQAKAKRANKQGDPNKFQNIIMPVVMPQVEAAVTYQQSVFLSGYPIFGVVSYPEFEDQALQMDTIIGEQQIRNKWIAELLNTMRDGFKYNMGICECDWERDVTYSLETDPTKRAGQQKQVIWEGNRLQHWDMYNSFWDTRCKPKDVPEWGEFAGTCWLLSRIALKKFIAKLPTSFNVKEAFESGYSAPVAFGSTGIETYFLPQLNPEALLDLTTQATTDWMAWAGLAGVKTAINYKNMYQVTKLYGRIMPSDFDMTGLPAQNTPQVWKFYIVNNQVIIYAERMTNAHDLIPTFFYQPLEDGLGYQTKSFAKNVEPIQSITSALANSSIAARRRAISDRMLYDPSRVSPAAINNDNPNAKIPVRPSAYQDDLSKAIYPIPFNDDQFQYNSAEIQQFLSYGDIITGLNKMRQGQFVKGNKTRYEVDQVMGNANGRDQTVALTTEASFFTPLKEVIKTNILQYQGGTTLYNREASVSVSIDPVELRKAIFAFKVSDGLAPSEKLIDGDSLALAMQTIASNQTLAAGYNLAPMFSYLMKSRGANLVPFEKTAEQSAYEQALATWQQAAMGIAQSVMEAAKQAQPPMTQEQLQQMLDSLLAQNPQPKPEDYGYVPGKAPVSPGNPLAPQPTIMETLAQQANAGRANQLAQGQRGAAQAGVAQGNTGGDNL